MQRDVRRRHAPVLMRVLHEMHIHPILAVLAGETPTLTAPGR
jgi:hypothetical protein